MQGVANMALALSSERPSKAVAVTKSFALSWLNPFPLKDRKIKKVIISDITQQMFYCH